MRVLLVRHGDIEIEAGQTPVEAHLSEEGQEQSTAVAGCLARRYLPGLRVASILSSPALPAIETAGTIAEKIGTTFDTAEALSGRTAEELRAGVEPDMERLVTIQEGAWEFIEGLRDSLEATDAVVLVSHETTIRVILCRALQMPLEERARFRLDPGSLSAIDFRQRLTVSRINDTCHLRGTRN